MEVTADSFDMVPQN